MSENYFAKPIRELHRQLIAGECDVAALTEHFISRIEQLNPELSALVHLDIDAARNSVERLQRLVDSGTAGPLAGLLTADKDLVRRQGMPTGYGTAAREAEHHLDESDPMAKWVDQVGAHSVGKTATSEFGLAGYTEPDHLPPARNPHNTDHQSGGSSGGAAVAVASGMLPFAPGSDGGGSIRIPALSCGITGWKPSRGLIPAGHGLDSPGGLPVAGLLTKSADDMSFIAGELISGPWTWSTRAPETALPAPIRVGMTTTSPWPLEWGIEPGDEARIAYQDAARALEAEGAEVVELSWEPDRDYHEYFLTLWAVGAAAIEIAPEKESELTTLTRYLRAVGAETSGVDYNKALRSLAQFEKDTISQFAAVDVVLTPGISTPAPPVGHYSEDPETNFRQQVEFTPWTSFVNVAGLPAVALPTRMSAAGLPLGAQLIGRPGSDRDLIALAAKIEHHFESARVIPTR